MGRMGSGCAECKNGRKEVAIVSVEKLADGARTWSKDIVAKAELLGYVLWMLNR